MKIVLLGGPCVGKSTFANKVHTGFFRETYYPTHESTMLLFDFKPDSAKARTILDEYGTLEAKQIITKDEEIILSPVIFQSYNKASSQGEVKNRRSSSFSTRHSLKNNYYSYKFQDETDGYKAPLTTPIQLELIDTPPFKPHLVVPFLEVSLYRNLDKEDLHNLANEPRRPVSTNPLLVASGASKLDGNVNGYIFTYCAVPSLNPPSYDETAETPAGDAGSEEPLGVVSGRVNEESLSVLELMRGAIFDAWKEFRTYQKKREKGTEGDVFSLVYGIRQLWKTKNQEEEQRKLEELRKISAQLEELNIDPCSPDSPPPIIIMCTNVCHDGASPLLIEQGKKLAHEWKASFVMVDNKHGDNIEEALALMVREVVEREKLQKRSKKKW